MRVKSYKESSDFMFGLLGKKLGHSFSKTIHEKFIDKEYKLIETDNLNQFFNENTISGLNVTIPYKKEVIKYLDKLSTEAKEIGAVNTVINKNGTLFGYNTDYYGLDKSLKYHGISVANKTIIILGNGSTSRTISYYCTKNSAKKIIILARNPKENEYNFNDVSRYSDASIVFNATPVGMFPNNNTNTLINLKQLPHLTSVIDVVYNPLRSNLILEAEELGIKAVNGLLMLIYQAIKSIELFHNITISDEIVTKYYKELTIEKLNFVFIGMPMSGKTFFSRLASSKYNKKQVEIDEEITIFANNSIDNIFKNHGENHFRSLETKIISKYAKLNNQAISCGGGVILNKENMVNLKQNGIIIFIDMPLELLKQCNPKKRPLLQDKNNLETLYNDRIALYRSFQDITINKTSFDKNAVMRQIEVKIDEYISTKWS